MGWSALLPKIKKRTKTLRDPTIITFPHFLRTLGVFRRQMCPVTSGRVDNCVRVGQRPYACLTISGRHTHSLGICTHTYTVTRASVTLARTHDPMLLSWQVFVPPFPWLNFPFPCFLSFSVMYKLQEAVRVVGRVFPRRKKKKKKKKKKKNHKRERCTVCSQCAPLPSASHPFSLMKKVSFGRFQPLSFDFISRNNGSWAF